MQEFHHTISLDPALARGLNYYTGTIMEIKALDFSMGSISGGGRYDDLTGVFGLKNMSGVGISFGAERIYDILAEGGLFPEFSGQSTQVLLVNFGADGLDGLLGLLQRLRRQGVRAELYPEASKLGKQFAYADARQIPYVVIIGEEERQKQGMQVKDMRSGEQRFLKEAELLDLLADKTY